MFPKIDYVQYVFDFSNRKFHRISPSSHLQNHWIEIFKERFTCQQLSILSTSTFLLFACEIGAQKWINIIDKPARNLFVKKKKKKKRGNYSENETPYQIPLITQKVSRNKSPGWKPFEIEARYAARRGVKKVWEWTRCLYTCLHTHYKFPLKLPSPLLFLITFPFVSLFYFYFISSTLFLLLFFCFFLFCLFFNSKCKFAQTRESNWSTRAIKTSINEFLLERSN